MEWAKIKNIEDVKTKKNAVAFLSEFGIAVRPVC